ncbi:hypothetical protein DICPUDRAFT_91373 [Dictyostelium purpureum]|uniref:IPT/TIG domain-containing protein n=1 Tax=Dictyostelium purpureum TaxID=5786 RepID=F0ZB97_DICPU|nr:uncharacterized protein DICPUDRAFT_91373 [Dictyostelium purpureum]EGC38804.1 hypothetical protein DICPUDRAFT_91373 [Dictyostelium purpureum]|eukprot:XP_003284698.1 hypothetical protein DICPUDRAFT_91373 [Dictyostelium purpureum]
MRLVNTLLRLSIFFTFFYYVKCFDYSYVYQNQKLIYTSTASATVTLSKIALLDNSNKELSKIPFTCTLDASKKNVCTSDILNPANLISWRISFYAKDKTGKESEKNDGTFPSPAPNLSPLSKIPTKGGQLLLKGDFLRLGQGDPTVITFISDKTTSLKVIQQSGSFDASSFSVNAPVGCGTFNIKIGTKYFSGSYISPTITSIDGKPGQYKIQGTNFFNDATKIDLKSGTTSINQAITSVSDSEIVLNYTPQYAELASISLSVGSLSAAESYSLKIAPMLGSYVPDTVTKSSGGVLTIAGKCLSPPPGSDDAILVDVGGVSCPVVTNQTDSITCNMPKFSGEGDLSNLKITVSVGSISSDNSVNFAYFTKPILETMVQNNYNFTVSGKNLGTSGTSIIVTPDGSTDAVEITKDIQYDQEEKLVFTLPINMDKCLISIKTDQGTSNPIQIDAKPVVSSFKGFPPTKGGLLVIGGAYIDPASKDSIVITVSNQGGNSDGMNCGNIQVSQADGTISCDLPAGTGNKLVATIVIGDVSFPLSGLSYQAPSNIKIQSQKGDVLEISGDNLGSKASLISLKVGDKVVSASNINSDQTVATFSLPSYITSNKNTFVIVDGVQSESQFDLAIKPQCLSIEKSNTAGQDIFITGAFFDSSSKFQVSIGGSAAIDVSVVNATVLKFAAPKGSGSNKLIAITYNGEPLNDENKLYFSYNPPTILSATSVADSKGGVVTVYGSNFAENGATVKIDSKVCSNITVINSNSLKCTVPPAPANATAPVKGKKYPIIVSIDGQSVTENKFEYNNEAINTIPPELTKPPVPTKKTEPTQHPQETPSEQNNNSNIIYHSSILILVSIIINIIF